MSEIAELENGDRSKNYPSREEFIESGIPFINAGHLRSGGVDPRDMNYITRERFDKLKSGKVQDGDILFCLRGSLGKTALVKGIDKGAIASSLVIVRLTDRVLDRFMLSYFSTSLAQAMIECFDNGTAQPNLSSADLGRFGVPLPPLTEQLRIIAKVDELMLLCDRLEGAQAQRERRRDALVMVSLRGLNGSVLAPARVNHARFLISHIPRFVARKEHIHRLRESIRSLGVRGRLVPQAPGDEPAGDLLKRINANAKARVAGNSRERSRFGASLASKVSPDGELPESWCWASTENVCEAIVDCPHSTPLFVSAGVVCLDTNCFKNGQLIPHRIRYVSEETYMERVQRLVPRGGDVVFAREGSVGASVIVPEAMKCCLGQRVMLFRLASAMLPAYFTLALSEGSSLARLLMLHKGIGARHINVGDMRRALIPVPPLAEQHRIVAKVDEMMAICDRLEMQLETTERGSRRLLEAVLHKAFAVA